MQLICGCVKNHKKKNIEALEKFKDDIKRELNLDFDFVVSVPVNSTQVAGKGPRLVPNVKQEERFIEILVVLSLGLLILNHL